MSNPRVSIRQLIAALKDVQAKGIQYITIQQADTLCRYLEASPVLPPDIDREPYVQAHAQGCQHPKTVNIGTMQSPGGVLCLDCNAEIP